VKYAQVYTEESVMRIESHGVIPAGISGMTGDLVSRLEKGDVIRAKVLETSPGEVALRLSDGTVLKAATVSEPEFKAGDMVTLSVKARTETRIILEIASDQSSDGRTGSSRLLKLLGSLGMKPDKTNLELASEFLKFKTRPTAEDLLKSLELLRESAALDPEKAAFIVSKQIDLSLFDREMLARFLDGELKLGQLLETLAEAIDLTAPERGSSDDADVQMPGRTYDPASGTGGENAASGHSGPETPDMPPSLETQLSHVNFRNPRNGHTGAADLQGKDPSALPGSGASGDAAPSGEQAAAGRSYDPTAANPMDLPHDSGDFSAPVSGNVHVQVTGEVPEAPEEVINPYLPGTESGSDTTSVGTDGNASAKSAGAEVMRADSNKPGSPGNADTSAERLKGLINDLFVKIDRKLSANDIDTDRMKERITNLFAEAENFLHSSQAAVSDAAANVSRSLALIGETVKIMDLLNSFHILYWQIPVNLGGNKETAELYVMKRRQNRKRIDPHDTAIFLSLDTQNMGRVEALLDVKGNGISMDLRTESSGVSDFIRSNINSLYSGISECGYRLVNVTYSVAGAPADLAEQEKLLLAKANRSHTKIDYRI